ncbi:MAG: glycosyltransferase family 4 protein [Verrucomicrobiaceae bacterium]|nr:glycosyltransferase family 4 protein [Verrucomicrobiaceae bacterium]
MDSQRVLIIVENLPVPLDRRVWQEACTLRDAGHQVTVICPQMRGHMERYETIEGIKILRHRISKEASSIPGFLLEYTTALLGEMRCAIKAWRDGGFDVIHICNPPDLLFLVALPFKLLAGIRIIFDAHDLWPEMFEAKFRKRGLFYWMVRLAERCTLATADAIICTNASVQDHIATRSNRSKDTFFVVRTSPTKIDTRFPAREALRRGKKHLVAYIGVMGNLDGVDYLLRAAHHIVTDLGRADIHFLLMGNGPEYTRMVELRDFLGLTETVEMPGRVSDDQLSSALQTMDLGITCDPINEYNDCCTMNKTLEYMAFSKPQVMFATREGKVSAGDSALYVHQNSAKALAAGILELLDDPLRREIMGRVGRARLESELSWENSAMQLLRAYKHATTKR